MRATWGQSRRVGGGYWLWNRARQEAFATGILFLWILVVVGLWIRTPRMGRSADDAPNDWELASIWSAPAAATPADAPDEVVNSLGMTLRQIPAGSFQMGSTSSEEIVSGDERSHPVRITRPFYLAIHEVTVGQFTEFVDATGYRSDTEVNAQTRVGFNTLNHCYERGNYCWRSPGIPQRPDHPVVLVTWNDAMAFCQWLSRKEGCGYRLPTEAEWEYACRAGSPSRFSCGDSSAELKARANICRMPSEGESPGEHLFARPVGSYPANDFGLHDMHGNAWEWCHDRYDANYYRHSPRKDPQGSASGPARVIRGGSFLYSAWFARCANRDDESPSDAFVDVGFRVARDL